MDCKQTKRAVYGAGGCQPAGLQCLANPKAFTANLAIQLLLQVSIGTYAAGMIRTLEKRFSLTSSQTGFLTSVADMVQVVVVLILSHFGRRAHKPRVLSISLVILAVGAFIHAIPYFAYGTKENIVSTTNTTSGSALETLVCHIKEGNATSGAPCKESSSQLVDSNHVAFVMFVCGAILIGMGQSSLQVFGISYIDENVKHEDSAVFIGFATAGYPLGPIMGFLMAAVVTSFPENLSSSTLETTDPAFIGAWWLGYTIFPALMFVLAIPMFFFPKHFPEYYIQHTQPNRKNKVGPLKVSFAETEDGVELKGSVWKSLEGIYNSFVKILSKTEYVTNVIAQLCKNYLIIGLAGNMVRYLETYFLQPTFIANVITALSVAIPGVIGTVLAGFIIRKLHLKLTGKALMSCISIGVLILLVIVLMFLPCPDVDLAHFKQGKLTVDLPCAANCVQCPRDLYLPVCGQVSAGQRNTFMSPCHAGCQGFNGSWSYSNCSCLSSEYERTSRGPCTPPCDSVYGYAAVVFMISMVFFIGKVPDTIINLRVVDPEQRTFALGFQSFIITLCGYIPGPMLFGYLTDVVCLVWSENCGETGNCLFYDPEKYRYVLHGVCLWFIVVSLIFQSLAWFTIKSNIKKGVIYPEDESVESSHQPKRNQNKAPVETTQENDEGFETDLVEDTDRIVTRPGSSKEVLAFDNDIFRTAL